MILGFKRQFAQFVREGSPEWFIVAVDGQKLDIEEKVLLAWRDGFRGPEPFREMMKFWRGRLPFKGKIIHWKFPGA